MVINIEIKTKNNETYTKRMNETMRRFFENINMIEKHLAKLMRKEKTQIRDKNGVITIGYN